MTDATPSQHRSQIYILPDDILWKIFGINANAYWTDRKGGVVHNMRPLTVLRRSSTVCQKWRRVILQSPSLWSRVLDLDLLRYHHEEWWRLVLERCGDSALCVKGSSTGTDSHSVLDHYVVDLLHDHWTRMWKLDLDVMGDSPITGKIWPIFLQPAPKLEVFTVYRRTVSGHALNLDHAMFAGHAPCLKEVSFTNPTLNLVLDAAWLSQLRVFGFGATSDATTLLNALRTMPNLNRLVIEELSGPKAGPEAMVSLPDLYAIRIYNNIHTAHFLLTHIIPASGATLFFSNIQAPEPAGPQEISDIFSETLSRYARNFFSDSTGPSQSLTIKLWDNRFRFRVRDTIPYLAPVEGEFVIDVIADSDYLPGEILPSFLPFIDLRQYTLITEFKFILVETIIPNNIEAIVTNFLSSLCSVTLLIACQNGISAIHKADRTVPNLLPSLLTTLRIREPFSKKSFVDSILEFLRHRAKTGRPLKYLDITGSTKTRTPLDWRCLEELDGLKVTIQWGGRGDIEEYICGSGVAEALDMRNRIESRQ